MTPGIDIRLLSMIRSMTEVIGPAIDPTNNLAREQAALMTAQLQMVATQWRHSSRYAEVCLADLRQTVQTLKPDGGEQTLAAAAELHGSLANTHSDAEARYHAAARAAEALIRAASVDGTPEFRDQCERAMLDFTLRQSARDRSWFALTGFGIDQLDLKSIDQLLSDSI